MSKKEADNLYPLGPAIDYFPCKWCNAIMDITIHQNVFDGKCSNPNCGYFCFNQDPELYLKAIEKKANQS